MNFKDNTSGTLFPSEILPWPVSDGGVLTDIQDDPGRISASFEYKLSKPFWHKKRRLPRKLKKKYKKLLKELLGLDPREHTIRLPQF